jgi:iron-sulfur cluster assembly protein
MTTLTENAVEAIRLYAKRQVPPQAPQIRIAAEGDDGGLTVHLVSAPHAGDRVVDRDGARLCLDEQVGQAMNGKALNAVIMPVGAITFSFQDEDR